MKVKRRTKQISAELFRVMDKDFNIEVPEMLSTLAYTSALILARGSRSDKGRVLTTLLFTKWMFALIREMMAEEKEGEDVASPPSVTPFLDDDG
jgi:hypothetical protein